MLTEDKKICIVIPAYNAGDVIERCLQSLQAQSYSNWTAVVIDDGSKDDTAEKIASFADNDTRIHPIQGRHAGASAARNQGLEEVEKLEPDYITFLDSDDYLEPDTLEVFIQTALRTGADIVHCKYFSEYVNGYRYELSNLFPPDTVLRKEQFARTVYWKMISGIQMNHVCTKFYKAGLMRGMRFDTTMRTGEDLLMNIGVFSKAESYAYLARPLYHYIRDMAQGLTNSGMPVRKKLMYNWRISLKMLECLPDWKMDTLWYRLCVICRPLVLICSKTYRGILTKLNHLRKEDE